MSHIYFLFGRGCKTITKTAVSDRASLFSWHIFWYAIICIFLFIGFYYIENLDAM